LNFSIYIAKRYLFSKKSNNIINIITKVSIASVTIGAMALIVVLSVFNGFEKLVLTLYNTLIPDLQITANEGKTFVIDSLTTAKIKKTEGVTYYVEVIEENALINYKSKQDIATLKGVGPEYQKMTRLDTLIVQGNCTLNNDAANYAVVGQGISYKLGVNPNDFNSQLIVYIPKRGRNFSLDPSSAFNYENIPVSGIFSIQQEYDSKYIFVPIEFARNLLDYTNEVSSIEIGLASDVNKNEVQKKIQQLVGSNFKVKNRFQSREMLYKVIKSEKWAVFFILTFILLIATFNIIGSISMLIIDKKKDILILSGMGANEKLIRRVFLMEGVLISFIGAVSGLIIGTVICWIQIKFGLLKIGSGDSFVINEYPVHMQSMDYFYVFCTVLLIGILASWYPVRQIKLKNMKLGSQSH
jgi:lipoprotein-releasing system permease protein